MEIGRIIGGKYRLRREIGHGAMGSVWAGVHETLGRAVAVKFLRPRGVNPETAGARFVAEARMAAAVKHRFVVDIFDFGITEDGQSYMVLELLDGEELGDRMYYGPPVALNEAVGFIGQCLSGLEAVHEANIVHRDLKPENIFLIQDADGLFPKLLDFGISKMNGTDLPGVSLRPARMSSTGRQRALTLPGTIIGTPWYMSPEQLRGASDLDSRTDIYSMGVILYEWLVGKLPFDDDNIGDLLVKITNQGPPILSTARPELGTALSDVLARAMAPDRDARFANAGEMRDALSAVRPNLPQEWTMVQKSLRGGGDNATVVQDGHSLEEELGQSDPPPLRLRAAAMATTLAREVLEQVRSHKQLSSAIAGGLVLTVLAASLLGGEPDSPAPPEASEMLLQTAAAQDARDEGEGTPGQTLEQAAEPSAQSAEPQAPAELQGADFEERLSERLGALGEPLAPDAAGVPAPQSERPGTKRPARRKGQKRDLYRRLDF